MTWGQVTALIYGSIRDSKYAQAVKILHEQLDLYPESQAALSLLGYCHYCLGDYHAAAAMYEQLTKLHPNDDNYRTYQAQALYKAGMLGDATKISLTIEAPKMRVVSLQACIRYEQEDIPGSRMILEQNINENMDAIINLGCCLYKEENYQAAYVQFTEAANATGFQPELAYNRALCLYKLKSFPQALKVLMEIFEHGMREYPELNIGSHAESMELLAVGNSPTLKESALVEAFNLKCAIEYVTGNIEVAKQALKDMPPRAEEELDSVSKASAKVIVKLHKVCKFAQGLTTLLKIWNLLKLQITLHNQGLINMDTDPTSGFRKLNFLLQNPPFPPETFGNLLLLYCMPSYGFYDLAADVMAENVDLTFKHLSQDLYDFLDATILTQTSIEEAYQKFNELANRHGEVLRRLTKQVQDARNSRDVEMHKKTLFEYDQNLKNYVPVLMAMAKICWDKENYSQVERIFQHSIDICAEQDAWKLNVAHTFFMQDDKYREAIHYYEPIVKKAGDNILTVTAIVLANLCVSYIMTNRNDDAEDLMRRIEKEEERIIYEDPGKQNLHLCIVNLVIGTLYCVKQNFEFGISRIIKSLEPYGKKIEMDTWFYAKRCILALMDNLAQQMIMLKDCTFDDLGEFLDAADAHSKNIPTQVSSVVNPCAITDSPERFGGSPISSLSVSDEARLLKRMLLKLRD